MAWARRWCWNYWKDLDFIPIIFFFMPGINICWMSRFYCRISECFLCIFQLIKKPYKEYSILHTQNPRLREVKCLDQGHSALVKPVLFDFTAWILKSTVLSLTHVLNIYWVLNYLSGTVLGNRNTDGLYQRCYVLAEERANIHLYTGHNYLVNTTEEKCRV